MFSRTSFKATDALLQCHTQLSNKSDMGRVRKTEERNIHRLEKVESLNPTLTLIAKIYSKRCNDNKYAFLESLKCIPDSRCTISLMSLDTCENLGLKPKKLKTTILLVNASGGEMENFGTIEVFMKAQNGRKFKIKFLIMKANKKNVMICWSDLEQLGILPRNFPEVISAKVKTMDDNNEDIEMRWLNKEIDN